MEVLESAGALSSVLERERRAGNRVGLVPTMGALHEGHRSLIAASRAGDDVTVVSVFVNPLQFGPGEDLDRYPREPASDAALAEAEGAAYVFAPSVDELYPLPVLTTVHVAGLTERLEGPVRPGHFDGVVTVLARLFGIVGRCRAYFGEKDYQQLLVVRRLVTELRLPAEVVACPTVRDADGLALSSRNRRLSAPERSAATALPRALFAGAALVAAGERSADAVRDEVAGILGSEPLLRPDYVEVADPQTLEPLADIDGPARLLAAVRVGDVRLIDNVPAEPPPPVGWR